MSLFFFCWSAKRDVTTAGVVHFSDILIVVHQAAGISTIYQSDDGEGNCLNV